jgi:hypothetical protein
MAVVKVGREEMEQVTTAADRKARRSRERFVVKEDRVEIAPADETQVVDERKTDSGVHSSVLRT